MLTKLLASAFPLTCPGCGRVGDPVCAECLEALVPAPIVTPPRGVDWWASAFSYEGVARELVARAKYRGFHAVNAWLADRMVALVGPPLPSCVTWVPTTAPRRRDRGFDHAELLAGHVAIRVGRPARRLLTRGPGPPQTGLTASARRIGPRVAPHGAAPADVLVVDDVATTGASLAAAAVALRAAGADRVVALTAARTPAP